MSGELAGDCDKASADFAFVTKATCAGVLGAADDDAAAALEAGARPGGGHGDASEGPLPESRACMRRKSVFRSIASSIK
eukprot:322532-Alexandrium_andersonii.AAC.1